MPLCKKASLKRKKMFIRKRKIKLRNSKTVVRYQAVESFRENGKVKQRVVSLGSNPNIAEVLNEELRYLQRMKKDLDVPLSEYKEWRWKKGWGAIVVTLPLKEAEKRKRKLEDRYKKQLERISKLDSLASRRR